ncbi:hypothetical protein BKA70DRAFT_1272151, partial [Coprinopsis sp. MPI-PUGE-AT-0042]
SIVLNDPAVHEHSRATSLGAPAITSRSFARLGQWHRGHTLSSVSDLALTCLSLFKPLADLTGSKPTPAPHCEPHSHLVQSTQAAYDQITRVEVKAMLQSSRPTMVEAAASSLGHISPSQRRNARRLSRRIMVIRKVTEWGMTHEIEIDSVSSSGWVLVITVLGIWEVVRSGKDLCLESAAVHELEHVPDSHECTSITYTSIIMVFFERASKNLGLGNRRSDSHPG